MQLDLSLGFLGYLTSTVLYLLVLIIHLASRRSSGHGTPFLLLIVATVIWGGLLTLSQVGPSIPFEMIMIAELLRFFTWIYVLQTADGKYSQTRFRLSLSDPLSPLVISVLFVVAFLSVTFGDHLISLLHIKSTALLEFSWMLLFSILGLIVVEQLYRNTPKSELWSVNFLCLSAGAVFVYDFFVFSNAVLTSSVDYEFWSARGIVNALIIPTLFLAAVRNPSMAPDIHVSRQFVFHSTTMVSAGAYLILMSAAGFYIRESSGDWGKILQAGFLVAALLLLLAVFFSASIKTRLKRYLSYSFRNKYDYREEWNRFSRTLLTYDTELSLNARALKAIAQIVDCYGASLWLRDHRNYVFRERWRDGIDFAGTESETSPLVRLMSQQRSLVTQEEFRAFCRDEGDDSHWFAESTDAWLAIPLWLNDELFGFVVLRQPIINARLDIEDIDLLNTVAHHVSLSFFLKQADAELEEAQRFKDMNQMTAFLVHDLKTVLSQLSLLVENAGIHKANPQFIDDMINTVDHATKKMQRLLQQLKKPSRREASESIDLVEVLQSIVDTYRHQKIRPSLEIPQGFAPRVRGDREELKSAIKHIVQNAVESVDSAGQVRIALGSLADGKLSVEISDNGHGMSREFVSERLFKPFDSTKGVTGMGVGVYQSREYVRSLSGEMLVESEPGKGTTFSINLPMEL